MAAIELSGKTRGLLAALGVALLGLAVGGCGVMSKGPLFNGMSDGNESCQASAPDGRDVLYAMSIITEPAGTPAAVMESIELLEPTGLEMTAAYMTEPVDWGGEGLGWGLENGMFVPPTAADLKGAQDHGTWASRTQFKGTRVEPGALGQQLGLVLRLTGKGDGFARGYRIVYRAGAARYVTESHFGLIVSGIGRGCDQVESVDLG